MISLEQIPIVYYILGIIVAAITIVTYIKNSFGLKIKVNRLGYHIKQFLVFIRLLLRLRIISEENLNNYEKMIDFDPCHKCCYPIIRASDSTLSPHIQYYFYITNLSIFDFKIEKISMNIHDQDSNYIDKIDDAKPIDLPHQQVIQISFTRPLHSHFINKLKLLKEKSESLLIIFDDVKIYLKDKKSPVSCGGGFNLKIHPMDHNL